MQVRLPFALVWIVGCTLIDLPEPSDGIGGQGGEAACTVSEDCGPPDNECEQAVCVEGACGTVAAPVGMTCEEGTKTCDGAGRCDQSTIGQPCTDGSTCASGFCVDSVCCEGTCGGTCMACNTAAALGSCAATALGEDPASECGDARCNGRGDCGGAHIASVSFGSTGAQEGNGIAVLGANVISITGSMDGVVDFGGGAIGDAGADDNFFAATLDVSLAHVTSFSNAADDETGAQIGHAIAIAPDGTHYIVGDYEGTLTFGNTTLPAPTAKGGFVAAIATNGVVRWAYSFDGAGNDIVSNVVFADDQVYVAGWYAGALTIRSETTRVFGGDDGFVAALDPATGDVVWINDFGTAGQEQILGMSAVPGGGVVLTGHASGDIDFGDGPVTHDGSGGDPFVVAYAANGDHIGSRLFACAGLFASGYGVAIDSQGDAVVSGFYNDSLVFDGDTTLSAPASYALFLAKVSLDGDAPWASSYRVGGVAQTVVTRVAVDLADDTIFFAGAYGGDLDFGGGQLSNAGGTDAFVAKYLPDGSFGWVRSFGDSGADRIDRIAIDGGGNLAVVGEFEGSLNLGGNTLVAQGSSSTDIFVARFGP